MLASVTLGLAIVMALVIAGGDRTEPLPLSSEPADGERAVPGSSSLVLRFGRPVEQDAVRASLVIDPPTRGTLTVDRSIVRFVPSGGWRSATTYTVTLRAGLADVSGRVLRRDVQIMFETRPARLLLSRPEAVVSDVLAARNLWTVALNDAAPRQLTREPLGILFAAVAPDGDRVAYTAPIPSSPNASSLWIANLDGSGRQQLAGDPDGAILSLGWSPSGDLIAYERRSVLSGRGDLGRPRILAVRPDGGGGGLLYGRGEEAGSQPGWSPDGRRLLVADPVRGGRTVVDPAGESLLIPGGGTDSGSWSPDGQLVAVAELEREPTATRSVVRIFDLGGRFVGDLGRAGYSDTAPAWAPNGRSIAVVGQHEDGAAAIWLLDPAGGPARQLVLPDAPVGAQLTPPVWSSGGAMLAFSRLVPRGAAGRESVATGSVDWQLWVANGDGTGPRRLPVDGLAEGWAP